LSLKIRLEWKWLLVTYAIAYKAATLKAIVKSVAVLPQYRAPSR